MYRGLNNLYWLNKNFRSQTTCDLYKRAKSSYHSQIRCAKLNYYSEFIEESDNKNKTVWDMVNTMTGRKNKDQTSIALAVDGVLFEESEIVAEIFADYFTSVAENAISCYYMSSISSPCTTSSILSTNFFFFLFWSMR